jgi:tetratricopeptide (TPR) repeat protein
MNAPDKRSGRAARVVIVLVLAAAGTLIYLRITGDVGKHPEPRVLPDITLVEAGDIAEEPPPANPGFIGPQACTPCHAKRVAEFIRTPHARACRRPAAGEMPAGFQPGKNQFTSNDGRLRFLMTGAGTNFAQVIARTAPIGEPVAVPINLVYGANKADEVFFTWNENHISELMAVWLHPLDRWAHTSYDPHGSGGLTRVTTVRCIECHNTWVSHTPGSMNEYRAEGAVLGVTCEKCHGPAKEHAAWHETHPGERKAREILNPAKLDRERRIEVCTQCHANFVKPRGPAFQYRPGEPLDGYYREAHSAHSEEDHVANQVKYLRESKCFQKSDLTCVTCHDPHRPHEPVKPEAMSTSCRQCHKPESCADRPRLPEAVRDNCVGCHMPQRVWMNVHFHTENDRYVPPIRRYQHRIAVDPIARNVILLAWHAGQPGEEHTRESARLRSELIRYWLDEAARRMSQFRYLAAIGAAREAMLLEPTGELRTKADTALRKAIEEQSRIDGDLVEGLFHLRRNEPAAAADRFEEILKRKPNHAVAHAKLGTVLAGTGRVEQARPHLEAVLKDDPDDAAGLMMLAWLAYLDGRSDEAVKLYAAAAAVEPADPKLEYQWGLAHLQAKQWDEASRHFRESRSIDPRQAGAWQGECHALRELNRPAEAVRAGRRAARLTQFQNADVLVTLAEAYAAAGREPEAAAAAEKAQSVAESDAGQPLSPSIRRRLNELIERVR